MTHEVETQWMGNMQFNALVQGHTVVMDAPERAGGNDEGPIPKPFVLTALTGCTGMDVVALLRKQNIVLHDLNLKVSGTLSKTAPMVYTDIHLVYEVQADANHQQPVFEAIQKSQNELCGVSAMLKKIMPVTWEIQFNQQVIFNNKTVQTEVL